MPLTGGVSGLKEQQVQRCRGEEASTFGEAERLQQCEGGSYAEDATREGLHLGAGTQVGLTPGQWLRGGGGGLHGGRRGPHDLQGGSWGVGWTCPLRRGGGKGISSVTWGGGQARLAAPGASGFSSGTCDLSPAYQQGDSDLRHTL